MYSSSYSSLRRLGLNTSSHAEPRMSQTEWKYAYNRPGDKPKPKPINRLNTQTISRTTSRTVINSANQPSTVQSMLDAANQRRQRTAHSDNRTISRSTSRPTSQTSYPSSDDEDPISQAARADRRVADLRKKHQSDRLNQSKTDRTKRRRTQARPEDPSVDQAADRLSQSSTSQSTTDFIEPSVSRSKRRRTESELVEPSVRSLDDQSAGQSIIQAPRINVSEISDPRERIRSSLFASISQARSASQPASASVSELTEQSDDGSTAQAIDRSLAESIEKALFELYRSTDRAYRQHARDVSFALAQNIELICRLVNGSSDRSLTPSELVSLPIIDLATQSLTNQRVIERESAWNEQIAKDIQGTSTNEYSCPHCQSRDCMFYTLKEGRDMRKAEIWGGGGDDSVSVYLIRCVPCGHSWKKEA